MHACTRFLTILVLAALLVLGGLALPALADQAGKAEQPLPNAGAGGPERPSVVVQGGLPTLATALGNDLDAQLAERLGLGQGPAKGQVLVLTTPVSVHDLELASPLSRMLAEELATWFVRTGYRVQEPRRARDLMFRPQGGEYLLTRRVPLLERKEAAAALVLAGTFSETARSVRFNIRLLHAATGEVMAMSSQTLPVTAEVRDLLAMGPGAGIRPSVATRLDPPRIR
jgi:hypothetical protein